MGEYWQVCNLTKREAYDTRGNYKTRGKMTYEMRGALLWLLGTGRWDDTDDIRLLSDYGQTRVIDKNTWDATEEHGPPSPLSTCDLTDIHFVVEPQRPLLTPAMSHALKSAAGARVPRFDEEKPPASRYEPEPDE